MSYIFVGLGNPGEEYENTRHNTGAFIVGLFRKKHGFPEWKDSAKLHSLVSKGKLGRESLTLLFPKTFMNKSGMAVRPLVTNKKKAEKLVVVYDDLDLPLGKFKISFGRGSGGHKGLESVIKSLKTKDFIRMRIGTCRTTPGGKLRKPQSLPGGRSSKKDKVIGFILGRFSKTELDILKKVARKAVEALEMIVQDGREKAMGKYNQS
jgi:PTH1 family peptidyl-tRNA hydrolase